MLYNLPMISKLIIHPDLEKREEFAEEFIKELKINKNHPDLMWLGADEKLGIEQARKIKDFLNLKPYQAKGQVIIVISAQNLTADAQNALLKTFEEHEEGVNLVLGAESEEQLLPTLLSRCQVINLQNNSTFTSPPGGPGVEYKYQEDIKKLLESSMEERFKFIEKLKEREDFLQALIFYFRHKFLENSLGGIGTPPLGWMHFLKDLVEAERWNKANVNLRAILEYLMLKIPQVK